MGKRVSALLAVVLGLAAQSSSFASVVTMEEMIVCRDQIAVISGMLDAVKDGGCESNAVRDLAKASVRAIEKKQRDLGYVLILINSEAENAKDSPPAILRRAVTYPLFYSLVGDNQTDLEEEMSHLRKLSSRKTSEPVQDAVDGGIQVGEDCLRLYRLVMGKMEDVTVYLSVKEWI